ncbi:metallophosphoesterase [uncultured Intestinimonas sp.]|uniref:metallophosphoesterase n=1 Tax=uncultured Intestinimonas sp. TaxID=1689265 RepID=UPI00262ABDB6|nr:metallophosphoesterase [uncultured Intestinimonas sp.]
MKKKNKLAMVSACAALAVTAVVALNDSLTTRLYEVRSEKVREPVRLVLLTDLHSCAYGAGQRKLLDAVEAQHPDLVLLGGDIVDDDPSLDEENAWTVVRALAERYPTFYVTGNHEFWGGRPEELKRRMEAYGATVLEGACETVIFQGQPLGICGVDDPAVGEESWEVQLDRAAAEADPDYFNILLTHRPERVDRYEGRGFDLVLAGHTHGGQWRIPGLLNGLLAPNQGFFPQYAGGRYQIGESALIISRGLARESTRIPRLFDPPEVVVVDVLPEG